MALQQKLAMRQGQALVMTPQLSQSIKLLALSNIELAAFVEQEIERNPFLEKGNSSDSASLEKRESGEQQDIPSQQVDLELTQQNELETSAKSLSENIGTSLENVYPDEQDYRPVATDNARTKEDKSQSVSSNGLQMSSGNSVYDQQVADYTASAITLRDHLIGQLAVSAASPSTVLITTDLIDNLDDAGYLRIGLEEIAKRFKCDLPEIEEALTLLQTFEPVGVGARDLSECLSLQLRDKDHFDPAMEVVVENLSLLAKRDFTTLQRLSGLDSADLHDALTEIRSLDPKPGTAYESSPVQHVVPDVHVRESPNGSWLIELNNETLPRALINNTYATEVSAQVADDAGKEFMTQCLQTANWLTKSLEQRAHTILKVTREIVKQQDSFLVHGVRHLRPLTLRMVADAIDMHESSVSRVTTNKYVMTPRGVFELKYFFTTAISSTDSGESHSAEAVRDQIRKLIDQETSKTVLSDDAIVANLKSSGIEIARRTIAKYRESMHIPSSVQRRREKKASQEAELRV